MKRKLLSFAMAVVMSAVCLAGCSGGWSRSAFISAAKKYGLKELDGDKTLREVLLDEEESASVYYVEKDNKLMQLEVRDYAPDAEVKEFVRAIETIGKNDNKFHCSTYVYYLTLEDSKNAKKTYKQLTKNFANPGDKEAEPEEGEKNGDYWNYLTATSGMPRELDKRTRPSMYVAPATEKSSVLGIAGVWECR